MRWRAFQARSWILNRGLLLPNWAWDLSLHLVTDERMPFVQICRIVEESVLGGVTVVQYRNKVADSNLFRAELTELKRIVGKKASLIANDRLDEVLVLRSEGIDIDGVHLGQSDTNPMFARHVLGPHALIGWTANTTEHAAIASLLGSDIIDYLGVGIIHATSTKLDAPEVIGVTGFKAFTESVNLPTVAIGGITAIDASALAEAGATGIAVVSAICSAVDPRSAANELANEFRFQGAAK